MIFLMSDLDLPLRGRSYRPPDGAHVAIVRARDLEPALEHVAERDDCGGLAVLGPLEERDLDLAPLSGRRLLVCATDGPRLRTVCSAGLAAGASVEWIPADRPDFDRLGAWALPVSGLILAAGSSSRMGQNKLLMDLGGEPLVIHVISSASDGGCHTVVAVYADESVAGLIGDRAKCIHNPDAASGMASSLRLGLAAMPDEAVGAVVLLGDQPLIGARTVAMLLRAWRKEGARPAVATSYSSRDKWLPPVVVGRTLWPDLMTLSGDAGARQLLDQRPELVDTVLAGGRPDDVDTPEDYARILHLLPRPDQG